MPRIIGIKYEEQVLEAKSANHLQPCIYHGGTGLAKLLSTFFRQRSRISRASVMWTTVLPCLTLSFYRNQGQIILIQAFRTPIELEPVGNSMLLGFDASVAERTIRFSVSQVNNKFVMLPLLGLFTCVEWLQKPCSPDANTFIPAISLFNLACVSLQFYMYSKVILRYRHSPSNRQLVKSKRIWRLRFSGNIRPSSVSQSLFLPVSKGWFLLSIFKTGGLQAVTSDWYGFWMQNPRACFEWSSFHFWFEMHRFSTWPLYHGKVNKQKKPPMSLYGETRPSWDFPIIQSSI